MKQRFPQLPTLWANGLLLCQMLRVDLVRLTVNVVVVVVEEVDAEAASAAVVVE